MPMDPANGDHCGDARSVGQETRALTMSKKNQKSRKKRRAYDPGKAKRLAAEHFARKIYLYRWESLYGFAEFAPAGPENLTRTEVQAVAEFAMALPRQWVVYVHACFVIDGGEYYEETREFLTPQACLAHDAAVVNDLIKQAAADAKSAGNSQHYVDTCVIMRLDSDRARSSLDDDDWTKRQAAHRCTLILESWRKGRDAA